MRRFLALLAVTLVAAPLLSQRPPRGPRVSPRAQSAEMVIKQAIEQLGNEKKAIERDLQVLAHIRAAEAALADAMQPSVAVQSAYERITAAETLNADFLLKQGLIRSRQELESARRSPGSADFGRLRSIIREHALGPASRLVVRNATRLQEETVAWLAVQELINSHVRTLSDITGASLRAAQQED